MTADRWTRTVRHQLALGRLLPLGRAPDGAWITEGAAEAVLRHAAAGVPGVRLDVLRIALADPEDAQAPVVPAPPSALPPGALRITADFAAWPAEPLPASASRLRGALAAAATEQLGLVVTEVDLRVTGLLEGETEADSVRPSQPAEAGESADPDEARAAAAALAVAGVARLTGVLGRAVHMDERQGEAVLPRRHVRVEIAVRADRRVLDVAREVRAAVSESLDDSPTVAVLVTAVVVG